MDENELAGRLTSGPVDKGAGGLTQRETGDRIICWGILFGSWVSAVGSQVQVFGFGYRFGR